MWDDLRVGEFVEHVDQHGYKDVFQITSITCWNGRPVHMTLKRVWEDPWNADVVVVTQNDDVRMFYD